MSEPTPANTGATLAKASLIVGIVAIVSAFIPYLNIIAWAIGLAGIVTAMVSLNRSSNKRLPMIGLMLSLFSGGIGLFTASIYPVVG